MGGIVCTSSNAEKVLQWAFERGERVMFFPDQHLGRNTAFAMGIGLDRMPLWDPAAIDGGASPDAYRDSKLILWKGHCEVHERFTASELREFRDAYPDLKIIAHPECPPEVIGEADFTGSTHGMINWVKTNRPAKVMLVTECSMSHNVAAETPEVEFMRPCNFCPHMKRITLPKILNALLNTEEEVTVDPAIAARARRAVERMIAVTG